VIKIATAAAPFTDYEKTIFPRGGDCAQGDGRADHDAHRCGAGRRAVEYLKAQGVPAHRIVIGHSCGSADHDYHMRIVNGGAYIGFRRFGLEYVQPDAVRVESLVKLFEQGLPEPDRDQP